tara:strand:+ start:107 stop:550 length:444 start_codon:yes stop_codon:yes gene_type:complete
MNILSLIGSLFGIGKGYLENKAKLNTLKQKQNFDLRKAQGDADIDRVRSNTGSDNQIDLITNQQKDRTLKDEVVTYLFLMPVFIATISPFITAFNNSDFTSLLEDIRISYENLDKLPNWYKYILGAIIIDVLGFRSFARKLIDKYLK